MSAGILALNVDLPAGTTLELRAAEETRPTVLLDDEISVTGAASSTKKRPSAQAEYTPDIVAIDFPQSLGILAPRALDYVPKI